jgi:hypothetical protein
LRRVILQQSGRLPLSILALVSLSNEDEIMKTYYVAMEDGYAKLVKANSLDEAERKARLQAFDRVNGWQFLPQELLTATTVRDVTEVESA